MQPLKVSLPHKSSAALSCSYLAGAQPRLLIFLNGMMGPQATWRPVIDLLPRREFGILTYDRFGQASTTDRNPTDTDQYGHDLNEVVRDLSALITEVAGSPDLVLVGNSIGCAIARHYAATYGKVKGVVLLDTVLANSDFHDDVFPDPAAAELPSGLSVDDLVKARQIAYTNFSPNNPNREGFDRRNMREILPSASGPHLPGDPVLRVVGHDPVKFAQDSLQRMGMPVVATQNYVQPVWERYNKELLDTSANSTLQIAEGCGHVIQADDPKLVSSVVEEVLGSVGW